MINIHIINDKDYFKWCFVRYLHPADHHPGRIRKFDRSFGEELALKYKISSQNWRYSQNLKRNFISISVFGYENKKKRPIYVLRKCCEETHVDLLLITEKDKRHYVLIKNFNTFMYDHTLHRGRKHFLSLWFTSL